MINYYSLLGILNFSAWSVVRKAYIVQIKKYHPDVNKTKEAILICKQLNVAKETLESSDKKALYDRRLRNFLAYGKTGYTSTRTTTRKRRSTPPPMSRAERVRRRKEMQDKQKLEQYAKGLKQFPVNVRYALCAL